MDALGHADLVAFLGASLDAGIVPCVWGDPGVGKSAVVAACATTAGLPCEPLILSQLDPTDIGGVPVVLADDGGHRHATRASVSRALRAACEAPTLLFLDEASQASPAVQAAAMRLIHDREVADRHLHPGTRIVLAANAAGQAAGGSDFALPLIGRLTHIRYAPSVADVIAYFEGPGAEREAGALAGPARERFGALLSEWAAIAGARPGLIQVAPPGGADAAAGLDISSSLYSSPRNIVRALRGLAAAEERGASPAVCDALVVGAVGADAALVWGAVRRARASLPSAREIAAEPSKAALPASMDGGLALLGLLPEIVAASPWSAWIYVARVLAATAKTGEPYPGATEAAVVAGHALNRRAAAPGEGLPRAAEGKAARAAAHVSLATLGR